MTDALSLLSALRRPALLIRAARFGLADYRRDRDLARLAQTSGLPGPDRAFGMLIEVEQALEDTRRIGDATYSVTRHIEVLIALLAEARLMRLRLAQV